MQTTFANLSVDLTNQVAQLTQKIATAICPEKIVCYGYRTAIYQDWSCFKDDNSYRNTGQPTFDLFVIIGNDNQQADHEIIQKIEQLAESLECDVSCVVQNLAGVNDLLQKGSHFLTTLYHEGVLLYESNSYALDMPPVSPSLEVIKSKLETTWNRCFSTAQRFLKTACFCLDNGWNEQALFDLHQAAQHACMALLRVYTGYRSTSHNLSRLLALIENFSIIPSIIFPCLRKKKLRYLPRSIKHILMPVTRKNFSYLRKLLTN